MLKPTNRLRWVRRRHFKTSMEAPGAQDISEERVLQQWWQKELSSMRERHLDGVDGQWRDVPAEEEN